MKINPTSLSLAQLLGATNEQYVVPPYQRRFSWKWQQLADLWDDIEILGDNDHHLLGTIVCLTGPHRAGLNELEVVDGQQRLTALSILLYCICRRFEKEGDEDAGREIRRMLEAKPLDQRAEPKIALDSLDQAEYLELISGRKPENPSNRQLSDALTCFDEWVNELELKDLRAFLYRLQNQTTIIRLEVAEARDAFKLFETINNRGLRLSSTDILKNFFLGNAARFGDEELSFARTVWTGLIGSLDGLKPDTFFRYFICAQLGAKVPNSKVVGRFKDLFFDTVEEAQNLPEQSYFGTQDVDDFDDTEDQDEEESEELDDGEESEEEVEVERKSFREFLEEVAKAARVYKELVKAKTGKAQLDRHLRNLSLINASPAYIFLLGKRLKSPGGDKEFSKILALTEAFLVRRHTCRSRTADNESIFARLCKDDCAAGPSEVADIFRENSPTNDQFASDFAKFRYTQANIGRARYALERIEASSHGSHDELAVLGSSDVQVEHIIPQKIKTARAKEEYGDWCSYLGDGAERLHQTYVSRIGNLTLFAGTLNLKASNNPYQRKCEVYRESAITITKQLPHDHVVFDFETVDRRSQELAKRALEIWPIP